MPLCLTCHRVLTELTYARHSLLCLLLQQHNNRFTDYPGEPVPEETLTHPPS